MIPVTIKAENERQASYSATLSQEYPYSNLRPDPGRLGLQHSLPHDLRDYVMTIHELS